LQFSTHKRLASGRPWAGGAGDIKKIYRNKKTKLLFKKYLIFIYLIRKKYAFCVVSVLIFIETLLFILVSYMMLTKSSAICVIISNIISAVLVFIYCVLQAPDIAITEAVIGTATSTILFALTLLYIKKLPTLPSQNLSYNIDIRQRMFVFLLCSIFFLLLIYIIQNLPKISSWDAVYPKISSLYINNAIKDFGFESIVTSVVAGYRAFDTMFENVVIFTACYGFYVLLTMDKEDKEKNNENKNNTSSNSNLIGK